MQTNNVISFPNKGNFQLPVGAPTTDAEVASNVSQIKFNHINETLATIVPMIFSNIELAGFDFIIDEDDYDPNLKDAALIVETLRSMLCKYYSITHPLQDIAEDLFVLQEDGSFTITDHLDIDLSDYEKGNS